MITADQVRDHIPGLTGDDDLLVELTGQADEVIARWLGWPADAVGRYTLDATTYVLRLGEVDQDARRLVTGLPLMSSVTSAYADTQWTFAAASEVPAASIEVDNDSRSLWVLPGESYSWAEGVRSNKVTVVSGYTDWPPGIVLAVASTARAVLDWRRSRGKSQVNQAGVSMSFLPATELVPPEARAILAPLVNWGSRVA